MPVEPVSLPQEGLALLVAGETEQRVSFRHPLVLPSNILSIMGVAR